VRFRSGVASFAAVPGKFLQFGGHHGQASRDFSDGEPACVDGRFSFFDGSEASNSIFFFSPI
jgi:hypothetical protein